MWICLASINSIIVTRLKFIDCIWETINQSNKSEYIFDIKKSQRKWQSVVNFKETLVSRKYFFTILRKSLRYLSIKVP